MLYCWESEGYGRGVNKFEASVETDRGMPEWTRVTVSTSTRPTDSGWVLSVFGVSAKG